ncbi:MAG: ABC transporter ATP-binding protein [Clostridiales bacterium]|nr:ABC transporter ATP-binding protein [Clostridiales bacterium]
MVGGGGGGLGRSRSLNSPKPEEKIDKKTKTRVLLRLARYLLRHKWLVILAMGLMIASNLLALVGPKLSGLAVDAIGYGDEPVKLDRVFYYCGLMLAFYTASAVLSYMLAVVMIRLSQKIIYTMRRQIFDKLVDLPVSFFDTHATGDIISHMSYDVDTVNASLSHDLIQVCVSIITVTGSLIMMVSISPTLVGIFAITVPASIVFTRYKSKKIRPLFKKRSIKLGILNGFAEEMLSGQRVIKAYGREEVITRRFDERNTDAVNAYYEAEYHGAIIGPGVNFINNLSIAFVIIFGGIFFMFSQSGAIAEGSVFFMTLGGITAFVQYSRKFAGPINEFANILSDLQSALAAAERVFRIIDEKTEDEVSAEKPGNRGYSGSTELTDVRGHVKLDHVKFGYLPGKTIIHDLSIDVPPGSTVAIVGPTGAGKTTIINLLMRFYDVDSGRIFIDNKEIRTLTRKSLRRAYTMVLQDTWLFGGTIYENITYAKEDATMEEVVAAAKAAKIHSFIESLPDGYNTMITDDGINISKGQKQLITMARAMLPKAPMLILDEATSNVDSRTEIKIQEAMRGLMKGRTCFIIAHRLSTIQNADVILVVKDGNVIEQGNHEQLMAAGGFYSSLYNSQFDQ